MDVEDIVTEWLKAHGFDGLAGDECGCELDDLMPCREPDILHCVAGRKVKCDPDNEDCRLDHRGWHMEEAKEKP